ncbi:hypothetical protein [Halalkalicoccus subterraneus]|uniref:hypothetical protein n=1 Tax=Halalkalicoccus subterraneus TaxID=2675002 RepID=UPI0013CEAC6E|nr:hypothetical protein [Halalkalicoccus subterraneus]
MARRINSSLRGGLGRRRLTRGVVDHAVVISAIQQRFLDTTGDLIARLDSISDNDVPRNGYQGQLTEDVTAEATRKVIAYFEETLAS